MNNKTFFLDKADRPNWFVEYPKQFSRIVAQGLVDFDPWYILSSDEIKTLSIGLKNRYPLRMILPFAKTGSSDDIACWDAHDLDKIYIVHDYASAGWEQGKIYDSFWDWFRMAVESTIEYEP